nr:unnamed protein product [Spirometra erinaceieuropaei]
MATNTDRTPEPLLPSFFIASTSAAALLPPTTTAQIPDTLTNTNFPSMNASDVGSAHTCPHYDRTFSSHTGFVGRLFRSIIRQNGGIRGSIVTLFRTDELKDGTLVGEDYLGNKYYENNRYFVGRNRDFHGRDAGRVHLRFDWYGLLGRERPYPRLIVTGQVRCGVCYEEIVLCANPRESYIAVSHSDLYAVLSWWSLLQLVHENLQML